MTGSASADDADFVEPTDTQRELNQQGLEALEAGEYESAIRLFGAALDLSVTNVTLANLARAHQRSGNCKEAERYYRRVEDAPAVETPPPELVIETVAGYRDEMREECPGYLEVECHPEDIELFIDGDGPEPCAAFDARELLPGHYELRGEYDAHVTESTVTIHAMQTSEVELGIHSADVDEPDEEAIGHIDTPPPPQHTTSGWMWIAAGTAAVAGGILLDTLPSTARNGQLDAMDFTPLPAYGAGVTFSIFGIQRLRR